MSLGLLLDDLEQKNIQLWLDQGQLRYKSPEGVMTEAIKAKIIALKSDIIARLTQLHDDSNLKDSQENTPFSQTPIQQAYLVGRSEALSLGGVAANSYLEFERENVDFTLAQASLNKVIARHAMLRTVLLPDNQQVVLASVPQYEIAVLDHSLMSAQEQAQALANIRIEMGEKVRDPYAWPLFDMQWVILPDRVRLHSCIDLIGLDAWSCQLLFREWFALLEGDEIDVVPAITFKQCLESLAQSEKEKAIVDRQYWDQTLPLLPLAPNLPKAQIETTSKQFKRLQGRIDEASWQQFKKHCQQYQVTPTAVLSTLFANVLSIWSRNEDVSLNFTLFNRPPIHEDINRVLGEFTNNTLVGFSGMDNAFLKQVRATQETLLQTLEHSSLSGVELLRELARMHQDYSGSIMPVVITSLLMADDLDLYDGLNWDQVYGISQTPQVALDHQLYQEKGGLTFNWDIAEAALDFNIMEDAFKYYRHCILQLSTDAEQWEKPIDRRGLIATKVQQLADTYRYDALSDKVDITQAFWANLDRYTDNQALIWSKGSMSYGEMANRISVCAEQLSTLGATSGDRVLVQLEKGPLQVIAVFAVLYVGAIYVPVAVDLPDARIENIADQTQPIARIMCRNQLTEVPANDDGLSKISTVAIDLEPCHSMKGFSYKPVFAKRSDPAYIIFTSGSTGEPKGVTLSHGAVQNTLDDMAQRFGMNNTDSVFALSALNFDLSVYDIFAPLSYGASMVIPDEGQERNPEHWFSLIQEKNVTIWNSVPTLLQMFLVWCESTQKQLPDWMRLFLVSGDWVPLGLFSTLKKLSENSELIALGGATEAAIWSNWYRVTTQTSAFKSVPYGYPLTNQYYRVLDKYGVDRPPLVPGELHIGGAGVALNYWGDKEKTGHSFISPESDQNERLYKTGDLGCFWYDGVLEFLGRTDSQVKLAGHRIELGEITAVLEKHPGINRSIALLQTTEKGVVLAAYVVEKGAANLTENEIKQHCINYLPRYMVPVRIQMIDQIPLSANGKVDQSALPKMVEVTHTQRRDENSLLSTIFQNVLGVGYLDKETNFFELGATSLQLISAHGQLMAETTFDIPVIDFFTYTTLHDLEVRLKELEQQSTVAEIHSEYA